MTGSPTGEIFDVAIVGAGISGLALADALLPHDPVARPPGRGSRRRAAAAHRSLVVLEAADAAGGDIRSLAWEGSIVERGPSSLLVNEELTRLIARAGLAPLVEETAPEARRRYLVRGGRLRRVSPIALLDGSLLGLRGSLRLLLEPALHGRRPDGDESVRGFAERHFGRAAYRYLAAPFVSGVHAGDPERLSVRAAFPRLDRIAERHGSLLVGLAREERSAAPRSIGLRGGNQELARALATRLGPSLRLSTPVTAVRAGAAGQLVLELATGERIAAREVVLALPAAAAAALVAGLDGELAALLQGFERAPVRPVHTLVADGQLRRRLDGFGYLVPRGEGFRHLGTIWSSALFPGRVPAGQALLTTYCGGATDEPAARLPTAELCALVDREHQALGLYAGEPHAMRADDSPAWIAQYPLGHLERVAQARALAARHGRLTLLGASYDGVAVGACVRAAVEHSYGLDEEDDRGDVRA